MNRTRFTECIRAGVALELMHWASCPAKDSPSPPPAPAVPDPANQTIAQAKALPSQYSPWGSSVYSGDPTVAGEFKQTITLSPEEQAKYEGRNEVAQQLLGRSTTALQSLPIGYQFRGAEDPTTNRYFTAQKELLDPVFERDEERLQQRLTNQGLPMGSEAYDYEQDQFRKSKASAYEQAAANALQTGFSQDIGTRQQNLNEVAQALGGSQLTPIGSAGNPLDVGSAYAAQQAGLNRAYQGQMGAYNADVAGQNSLTSGLFSLGAAAIPLMFSDRRLKRDIVRLGDLMPGVGWYAFHYNWEGDDVPLHHGVMADELEKVMPDAVGKTDRGYAFVDYGMVIGRLH